MKLKDDCGMTPAAFGLIMGGIILFFLILFGPIRSCSIDDGWKNEVGKEFVIVEEGNVSLEEKVNWYLSKGYDLQGRPYEYAGRAHQALRRKK